MAPGVSAKLDRVLAGQAEHPLQGSHVLPVSAPLSWGHICATILPRGGAGFYQGLPLGMFLQHFFSAIRAARIDHWKVCLEAVGGDKASVAERIDGGGMGATFRF